MAEHVRRKKRSKRQRKLDGRVYVIAACIGGVYTEVPGSEGADFWEVLEIAQKLEPDWVPGGLLVKTRDALARADEIRANDRSLGLV